MHPTSLMARVLRAKYFLNTNFLYARLGSYPSMVRAEKYLEFKEVD